MNGRNFRDNKMNYKLINVLLIEDNPADVVLIREMLKEAINPEFKLHSAYGLNEGLDYLEKTGTDILLLDLNLPDSNGLETFQRANDRAPQIPIVILSGLNDEYIAIEAVKGDAQDYLIKGKVDNSLLARSIVYAIERKSIEEELIQHRNHLEELVDERTKEFQMANKQLQNEIEERKKSEEEKELLLKEIYHRVKNNLMVISSLLNLQSRYIKDKKTLDVFRESQNRAKSMALIHERLYRSDDLKRINFGEYIRTLVIDLYRTYVSDSSFIKPNISVEDIMIDINTAVPLGLIVNELVSNSMKHAFPAIHVLESTDDSFENQEGMSGEISINFKSDDENFILSVMDNGIGFPEELDFKNTDSLGLRLVNSLTDQIHGNIQLKRNNGTEFRITFKETKY
jgi:two-component sensor histidine kinase/CheY-like chemotaxis protein